MRSLRVPTTGTPCVRLAAAPRTHGVAGCSRPSSKKQPSKLVDALMDALRSAAPVVLVLAPILAPVPVPVLVLVPIVVVVVLRLLVPARLRVPQRPRPRLLACESTSVWADFRPPCLLPWPTGFS